MYGSGFYKSMLSMSVILFHGFFFSSCLRVPFLIVILLIITYNIFSKISHFFSHIAHGQDIHQSNRCKLEHEASSPQKGHISFIFTQTVGLRLKSPTLRTQFPKLINNSVANSCSVFIISFLIESLKEYCFSLPELQISVLVFLPLCIISLLLNHHLVLV